jgi:hypothetical protein
MKTAIAPSQHGKGLHFLKRPGMPFIATDYGWSIGLYEGSSPFTLRPAALINPVLKAHDVTDVRADFVADPFLIKKDGKYFLFFEVLNADNNRGEIGLALSDNGKRWRYNKIILRESFHLSYPYVFEWNNEWYMIPETNEAKAIRLYRAKQFPYEWTCVGELIKGVFSDASILNYQGKWWLWAAEGKETTRLFYADDLKGPWKEHPQSPVVTKSAVYSRPGGRVIEWNKEIIRFVQDGSAHYGHQLFAFRVLFLNKSDYREELISHKPFLAPGGQGWNARKMHHVSLIEKSPGQWLAAVDGMGKNVFLGIRH